MAIQAVIDFETTGLSPDQGERPTEIAVVMVDDGKIVDCFQSLMNAGVRVPAEVQALTGITNAMVRKAPAADVVMREAVRFVGQHPLVAHNASFDCKFWDAELRRMQLQREQTFACSMLLSRRLFPQAPNHQLGTLVRVLNLPATGRYHRALADAEATACLLVRIQQEIAQRFGISAVSHELLLAIQKASRHQLESCVQRQRQKK